MRIFPRLACSPDARSVGHLENVRHVSGGGGIQDGDLHPVFDDVQDTGHQHARVERDGFPWLEVDFERVSLLKFHDEAAEEVHIIVGTRDVMSAPEVDPVHVLEIAAKFVLKDLDCPLQGVGVELAEVVEMKTGYSV